MTKLSPSQLKEAILKGLEGAISGEANRIVEGLEWLPDRELKGIVDEINKAVLKNRGIPEKATCFGCYQDFVPGENYRKSDDCPSCEAEIDQEVAKLMKKNPDFKGFRGSPTITGEVNL